MKHCWIINLTGAEIRFVCVCVREPYTQTDIVCMSQRPVSAFVFFLSFSSTLMDYHCPSAFLQIDYRSPPFLFAFLFPATPITNSSSTILLRGIVGKFRVNTNSTHMHTQSAVRLLKKYTPRLDSTTTREKETLKNTFTALFPFPFMCQLSPAERFFNFERHKRRQHRFQFAELTVK